MATKDRTAREVRSIAKILRKNFREDEVDAIARRTGFMQRKRDITPLPLLLASLSTLGASDANWLADILRTFNALTGKSVEYKPFHNQLSKPQFPEFVGEVFENALTTLTRSVLESLPEQSKLSRFKDILLQDGSSFALKDSLSDYWPGRFTKVSPAAVELHVTMSVFEDNPLTVTLAADKEAERQFAPQPEELRGVLILEDRGYQDRDFFRETSKAGGSFIVRGTKSIKPKILKAYVSGRRVRGLEGRKLDPKRLPRATVDMDIEWGRGEKVYRGRLIAIYKLGKRNRKTYTFLHTNLARKEFNAKEIGILYRLRWQVELLFKEWKSHANLHRFDTSNPHIAEGLIWASLLAATLKRSIAHAAGFAHDVEISTQRAASCATHYFDRVLKRLFVGPRRLAAVLLDVFDYLAKNARRAHPERDRRRGRFQAGLRQLAGS